jgi:hypothetical protein
VVEEPAEVDVAEVVLDLVEPGLHVGAVLRQLRRLGDVAESLAE